MKKQLNISAASRKLSLNKKTISNLTSSEMNKMIGATSCGCTDTCKHCGNTLKNKTCPGHKTCL